MKKLKEEMIRIDQELKLKGRKRIKIKLNKNENYYIYDCIYSINKQNYTIYKVDKKKKRIYIQYTIYPTIEYANDNYQLIRTQEEIEIVELIKEYILKALYYPAVTYEKKEKIIQNIINCSLQEIYDLFELEELIEIKIRLQENKKNIMEKIKEVELKEGINYIIEKIFLKKRSISERETKLIIEEYIEIEIKYIENMKFQNLLDLKKNLIRDENLINNAINVKCLSLFLSEKDINKFCLSEKDINLLSVKIAKKIFTVKTILGYFEKDISELLIKTSNNFQFEKEKRVIIGKNQYTSKLLNPNDIDC